MARRKKLKLAPDDYRQELIRLLTDFEQQLHQHDLRAQVRALLPVHANLRDMGSALLPQGLEISARERILAYLRRFPGQVIDGDELMVVSGISEYARRLRELRVQEGWPILSGNTARELASLHDDLLVNDDGGIPRMSPDQYYLVEDNRDREAADRWLQANQIRRSKTGVKDKILRFFRANVGRRVTSEELRYVAGNKTEWARRSRELRTEEGWPIITRNTGDPTLPIGIYVLERDEQAPAHDRHISELTRRTVMQRDNWSCRWRGCGWPHGFPASDHRFLEAHHIQHHAQGGTNEADNLVTLCNLHHDEVHRSGKLDLN